MVKMVAIQAIDALLNKWETRQLVAYIPCNPRNYTSGDIDGFKPIGVSGVTVATGLDLGQQGEAELRNYGLDETLRDKLRPYLGRKCYGALRALQSEPLRLSDAECDAISLGVHAEYTRRTRSMFNARGLMSFDDMPPQAQAVAVSLVYSLGSPQRFYPAIWNALLAGNYAEAANCLCSDFTGYDAARRRDEGALLKTINKTEA